MCKPGFVFNTPNNPWLLEKCMIYGSEKFSMWLNTLAWILEHAHSLSHSK